MFIKCVNEWISEIIKCNKIDVKKGNVMGRHDLDKSWKSRLQKFPVFTAPSPNTQFQGSLKLENIVMFSSFCSCCFDILDLEGPGRTVPPKVREFLEIVNESSANTVFNCKPTLHSPCPQAPPLSSHTRDWNRARLYGPGYPPPNLCPLPAFCLWKTLLK